MLLHNMLNALVQIANKMGLQKKIHNWDEDLICETTLANLSVYSYLVETSEGASRHLVTSLSNIAKLDVD
jgi:hypothetical protein